MNSQYNFVKWVMYQSSYGTVCFDESACFSDPNPERRHISDWTAAVYFVAATLSSVGQRLMFE